MNDALLLEVLEDLQKADQLPAPELQQMLQQYPWFAAAHLLHAAHQSRKNNAPDVALWQHAALYGNQPAVLEQQLQRTLSGNAAWPEIHADTTPQPSAASEQTDMAAAATEAQLIVAAHDGREDWIQEDLEDAATDANAIVAAHDSAEVWEQEELEDAVADAVALVEAAEVTGQLEEVKPLETTETREVSNTITAAAPLAFEPYHTVDYFASQGIRLQEEKLGSDELSRQVKTFTQWLRSMKKLYNETQTELPAGVEQAIHHIADTSNQHNEVLTETMAAVLVQQGKKTKAIEIYGKLILLHPEKSAYFADRIKQLK